MRHFSILLGFILVCASAVAQTAIYDIQYTTDPSGDSPMVGLTVTIEGVVTAASYDGFIVADAAGAWNSVFVYTRASGCAVQAGDADGRLGKDGLDGDLVGQAVPGDCEISGVGDRDGHVAGQEQAALERLEVGG